MPNDYEEESREKLKALLRKLFQFDVADLDFGIYKIMNQRRDEIEKFIEKDLFDHTEKVFKEFAGVSSVSLKAELDELRIKINEDFGAGTIDENGFVRKNIDAPKIKAYLRKQDEVNGTNLTQGQIEDVYNQVYEFFNRYFDKGDFFSKRRYGGREKYVVPYNGEEVKLHWANEDQYYVKTAENFNNYCFRADGWTIHFKIVHVDIEKKHMQGKERYYVLAENVCEIVENHKNFYIFFQYRELSDEEEKHFARKNKQEQLIKVAQEKILGAITGSSLESLLTKNVQINKETTKILLEKHLEKYVNRNNSDYFIHRNLYGFLSRELDFFIKNEIVQMNELIGVDEKAIKRGLARIKAIQEISILIIKFISQIEDFQKNLFEKKKLVLRTEYCMTLDFVPKEFYSEIASNKAQIAEWRRLFNLDSVTDGTLRPSKGKEVLDVAFLEAYPRLVIDTKFYSNTFKDRLLSNFLDIDESIGGLLIKSENYQGLSLLKERYHNCIKCSYIDPPYNTGGDDFVYRDSYQHSSWLTMMSNRLSLASSIMGPSSVIFSSIDDNEMVYYSELIKQLFGNDSIISTLIWKKADSPNEKGQAIATYHEYVIAINPSKKNSQLNQKSKPEIISAYPLELPDGRRYRLRQLRKNGKAARRIDRPNLFYPITAPDGEKVLPIAPEGWEGRWVLKEETFDKLVAKNEIEWVKRSYGWMAYYREYAPDDPMVPFSSIIDDVDQNRQGKAEYTSIMGSDNFETPKPVSLIKRLLAIGSNQYSIVLDFFAGSGTTAHAVLSTNEEDDGQRKYVLIEMGDHFETILKPRIMKIMFSTKWKDGSPIGQEGYGHIFKYLAIEQYEDTLSNIVFRSKSNTVQETLQTYNDYFLHYMLDYETRESPTRLSLSAFEKPFDWKMRAVNGSEEVVEPVDLVETFNYLLGLHLERIQGIKCENRYYRALQGRTIDEKNVLIVWRNTESINLIRDKEIIEKELIGKFYSGGKMPDVLYVNGICHVKNAIPIELVFKHLMDAS